MALDKYYNNCAKIVAACMKEIKAILYVENEDYKGLVAYKTCIFNNNARLSAAGLDMKSPIQRQCKGWYPNSHGVWWDNEASTSRNRKRK